MDMYRQYRPQNFEDVLGQDRAIAILKAKLDKDQLPHVVLLSGQTGTGKTTLAKIIASKHLGCTDTNLTEIDCADDRGMEMVRDIRSIINMAPMGGKSRVWIWDEVVQLPKITQQAALTMLETCPSHVWFLLCTTTTEGLLPTFLGRCFVITLAPLSTKVMEDLLAKTLFAEKRTLEHPVIQAITNASKGSARKALQLLEAALTSKVPAEQMIIVGQASDEESEKVESLARALFKGASWQELMKIVKTIDHKDLETTRRQILGYASGVLLSNRNPRANLMIRAFSDHWMNSGKAGLIAACWDCCPPK